MKARILPAFHSRVLPIAVALVAAAPGFAATPLATVVHVAGPVDVRRAEWWQEANKGDKLGTGDAVRTGQKGYATLRDGRGTVTELYPLASVEFPKDAAMSTLAGRIWTHFQKIPGLTREIKTPSAVALIRGTTLAVEANNSETSVTVLEGLVEVRDLAGKSVLVPDGYKVRADRFGIGRVERALGADLDQGRSFLDRSREWLGPAATTGNGAVLPGFSVPAPAPAPARAHRPSALERAEARFDQKALEAPRGAVARPGDSAAGSAGAGGKGTTRAEIKVKAGPGSGAAGVNAKGQSGDRAQSGVRAEIGTHEPAARAELGRPTPRALTEPLVRSDVGARTEPGARAENYNRTESRSLPGAEARVDATLRAEPAPRTEPAAHDSAEPPNGQGPAAGTPPEKKDRAIDLDLLNRPDILGR